MRDARLAFHVPKMVYFIHEATTIGTFPLWFFIEGDFTA
jgi:hypothetical protein